MAFESDHIIEFFLKFHELKQLIEGAYSDISTIFHHIIVATASAGVESITEGNEIARYLGVSVIPCIVTSGARSS